MAKSLDQLFQESGRSGEIDRIRAIPGGYEKALSIYKQTGDINRVVSSMLGGSSMSSNNAMVQMDPVENIINNVKNVYEQTFGQANKKAKEYLDQNPFAIDEQLARKSAEERLDPFYTSELNDFITGVNNTRNRSSEDEQTLVKELTISTDKLLGRSRQKLDDALLTTRQGYSDVGMYNSGARERSEGLLKTDQTNLENDALTSLNRNVADSNTRQSRLVEDLGLKERQFRRYQTADRETAIQGDINQQQSERNRNISMKLQEINPFYNM